MEKQQIWQLFETEMKLAKKKHPNWPDHLPARAGIVTEEAGELMKACLEKKYEPKKHTAAIHDEHIISEAVQTMVTAFRFLENYSKI